MERKESNPTKTKFILGKSCECFRILGLERANFCVSAIFKAKWFEDHLNALGVHLLEQCCMCENYGAYGSGTAKVSVFYPFEIILSHIPTHTRSSDPYVSSLSEKSVRHCYPCEISVTNTR